MGARHFFAARPLGEKSCGKIEKSPRKDPLKEEYEGYRAKVAKAS
jgi:hypothetical protein